MNRGLIWISGLGLGAGLMYLLDPDRGRRRRTLLRDRAVRAVNRFGHFLDATARDVSHRAQGLAAEACSLFTSEEVPDEVLVERVRSRMGRVVSHPHTIGVTARAGRVTLSGPILADEVDDLLCCVSAVQGVKGVENWLEVHDRAGNVPELQGAGRRPGSLIDFAQANWSPATRLLAGTVGCGLMANCLARRTPLAALLGTAGFALFLRGLTNLEFRRLLGTGAGRRAIDVQKTLTIAAPVEEVFTFWTNYQNFPCFMSHLCEVRDLGGGRSHWVAEGPGGMPVRWNAVLTRFIPNQVLAWRSEPGSAVAHAGVIRFERRGPSATRVDIRLSYNPPAGALGHFAATLFGTDPKSAMDEDLVRLKSLLETGKASAPGKRMTREEPAGMHRGQVPATGVLAPGGQGI